MLCDSVYLCEINQIGIQKFRVVKLRRFIRGNLRNLRNLREVTMLEVKYYK